MRTALRTWVLGCLPAALGAQAPDDAMKELVALMNTRVSVAARRPGTARETPGIVTVISREEILRSGARDLVDVLQSVPGFGFGVDVQGAVGISFRGLWAHEGKVLLLWDGLEVNETLYGNVALGQRFPVDQIERVEIIRGPGSSLYGGFAEVAVIQVTTVRTRGVGASLLHGQGRDGLLRSQAGAVAGGRAGGVDWDLGAWAGEGQRSRGTYVDGDGTRAPMGGRSTLRPGFLNLGLAAQGLRFRLLADQYALESLDNLGPALAVPAPIRFTSLHGDLRATFTPAKGWTLEPFLGWKTQKPWWSAEPATGVLQLTTAERARAGLTVSYDPSPAWAFTVGLERVEDRATLGLGSNTPPAFPDGGMSRRYHSTALFAQVQHAGAVNVTAGARYERSDATRSSFVPRLAFTKAWNAWHAKLLLARAFRSPAILNLNLPLDSRRPLEPEETTSSELEIGRRVGPGLLTLSYFDTRIEKPIVFTVTQENLGYFNQDRTGSRGWELEYRARWNGFNLDASWSRHEARNRVEAYGVPGHPGAFLGAPAHKLTASMGWRHGAYSFRPSAVWLGPRWAYAFVPAVGTQGLTRVAADLLLAASLTWEQGPWQASVSLHDLLDRAPAFIQPYNGGHPPLPGPGRELVLRLRHGF